MKPASSGDPNLLVFSLPATIAIHGEGLETFALPIQLRRGGLLLAIPDRLIHPNTLRSGLEEGNDLAMIGPNSVFNVPLFEEADDLTMVEIGVNGDVLVVDMTDEVLEYCREYDPVTDSLNAIAGFSEDYANCFPDCNHLF